MYKRQILDLHAQHEHQSLLIPGNHLKLLDRYGHGQLDSLKERVTNLYNEYSEIKVALSEHTMNDEEKRRQLDLLLFEQEEISKANLKPGEDTELEEQYRKISNGKNITESVSGALHYTGEVAQDAVDRAIREMTSVSEYDETLSSMTDVLATVSDLSLIHI